MAENSPLIAFLETIPQNTTMETPPRDQPFAVEAPNPPGRRSTRSALAEIPVRLNALTVQENTEGQTQITLGTPRMAWQLNVNLPASYVSPSPSPDELVIQQRGRRRVPASWSPDIEAAKQRTPVKGSPAKNSGPGVVLRSTPRKRLLLDGAKDPFTTPEKMRKLSPNKSPNSKRAKVDRLATPLEGPLDAALLAFAPQQIIDLLQQLVAKHPHLEGEIKDLLPAPDIRPLEERLNDLKKNIYKSLPNSRLTSKTDSPAFTRAATHMNAFKKCVLDQLRQLTSSQNWGTVVEYVIMAWNYVRATPLWDNPPHNNCRRTCFKSLTATCLGALKKGASSWNLKQLEYIESKLESMVPDNEDMQACVKHLVALKRK